MQDAGAVSADLHSGAKLAQFRRLLVNVNVDASADQCKCRREPTDAATDDGDVAFIHCEPLALPPPLCGTHKRRGEATQSRSRGAVFRRPSYDQAIPRKLA